MNKRFITSCWRIVCLATLVIALLLLSNVPNAHASTYSSAVSHTNYDTCNPADGTSVASSPVTGVVNATTTPKTWEKVGEVRLMWSNACGTNWVEFDPTLTDSSTIYKYVFLDLYTQGAGWTDTTCNIGLFSQGGYTCETSAISTGSVPAQAVATAEMIYTPPPSFTSNPYEWTAYGATVSV